jgi:outer membrane protein
MKFRRRAIGYIDSYRIRKEYTPFKEAQEQFNQKVEAWNLEVQQQEREIQGLEQSFNEQAFLYSDVERQQRVREIQQQRQDWQRYSSEIFGPEGEAEKLNQELTKPLLERINNALNRVAAAEGCQLILDTVNGNVAYGSKDLDLTDRVLQELATEEQQ